MDDLKTRFTYHPPTQVTGPQFGGIRSRLLEVAEYIIAHTPNSREQSLSITMLEQAMFWANAAIARKGE